MSQDASQRILIVEDDDDTRSAIADLLGGFGYTIEMAATAKEAVCHPRLADCSIVILDRILPDAMAEDVLPQVSKLAPESSTLILTGHGDLDSAVACQRLGAADYLLKPIDAQTLQTAIERVQVSRRTDQLQIQATRLSAIADAMTGLSHECRNALQRGQASVDLLMEELSDNPDAVRLVERIQSAQDDLQRLFEDVKSYAAPIDVAIAPCEVEGLVRQVWDELSSQCDGRAVSLTESVITDDTKVPADSNALQVVFRNLLENALATRNNATVEVAFADGLLSGASALQVRVSDNGPGIPVEVRDQVFDEFFTTRTHGTGLGLPICRRLVEAHGGTIELGASDSGADFIITLPRGRGSQPSSARQRVWT